MIASEKWGLGGMVLLTTATQIGYEQQLQAARSGPEGMSLPLRLWDTEILETPTYGSGETGVARIVADHLEIR